MADLTFLEESTLETLLQMGSGYVLNFGNRTLAQFVAKSVKKDLYDDAYAENGTSKANRLRTFWAKEPNSVVARLLHDLIDFSEHLGLDDGRMAVLDDCRRIVERLTQLAQPPVVPRAAAPKVSSPPPTPIHLGPQPAQRIGVVPATVPPANELAALHKEFLRLAAAEDRQASGRSLNTLLFDLFKTSDLAPSGSFRTVGEELDGALVLDGATYLLEAKWTTARTGIADLYVFEEKVRRKSTYTRGVFVSVNGYTDDGLQAHVRGGNARAVLLDGTHLILVLEGRIALAALLRRCVQHLSQYGTPYLPVTSL